MADYQDGKSIFSYPLTRQYPFRWFTYVAFIGGAICIVLFSFVALAADGYNLELEYTLHLDATLGASYWFDKPPFSWISKTNVSCQPALLTTGNTYFTSNLGLTYELNKLWRADSSSERPRVLPATGYLSTPLRDCSVRQIEINFMKRFNAQVYDPWNWDLTTSSATVTCTFDAPTGGVKANLTTELPYIYEAVEIDTALPLGLDTSISKHSSLWFGAQFTNLWYQQLSSAMGYAPYPKSSNETWSSGTVILSRNLAVTDYTDLNFFFAWVNFFTDNGTFVWIHPPTTIAGWRDEPFASTHVLPNITTTLDTFAKSLYSLLLSDFGVVDQTNALLDPAGVKWLGDQVDLDLKANSQGIGYYGNYSGRPRNKVQNAFNASGPSYLINETYQSVLSEASQAGRRNRGLNLNNTSPSKIFTQYLCSVPRRKSGGALFFAVLLADLVFLQTAWTVLNFVAGWWLKRTDKNGTAGFCDGCAKRLTADSTGAEGVGISEESSSSPLLDGGRAEVNRLGSTLKKNESVGGNVRARSRSVSPQSKPLLPEASALDASDEEK